MKYDRNSKRRMTRKGGVLLFVILLMVAAIAATFSLAFSGLKDSLTADTDGVASTTASIETGSDGFKQFKNGTQYVFTDSSKISAMRSGSGSTDLTFVTVDTTQTPGTQLNPYVLSTAADWETLVKQAGTTGDATSGKYYALANDIDFTGVTVHTLIKFKGTLYGCGFSFNNLTISTWDYWNGSSYVAITTSNYKSITDMCAGLICIAYNATIADFNLVDAQFKNVPDGTGAVTGTTGNLHGFGALIGEVASNECFVLNCSVSVQAWSTTMNGQMDFSGVVGEVISSAKATIYRCSVDAYFEVTSVKQLTTSYAAITGGLLGRNIGGATYLYDNVAFVRMRGTSGSDYLGSATGWIGTSSTNYLENFVGYCWTMDTSTSIGSRGGAISSGDARYLHATNAYVEGHSGSSYLNKYLHAGQNAGTASTLVNMNYTNTGTGYMKLQGSSVATTGVGTQYSNSVLLHTAAVNFFGANSYSNIWNASLISAFWNPNDTLNATSAATARSNIADSPVRNNFHFVLPVQGSAETYDATYDGGVHDLTTLASWWTRYADCVKDVTYSSAQTGDTDANICKDAGTYYATVTLKDDTDIMTYKFADAASTVRQYRYTITIKQAKFNLSSVTWDYDAANPPEFTGASQTAALKASTIPSGLTASYSGAGLNAGGTYRTTVTFSYADSMAARNYILPDMGDSSTYEGTFTWALNSWTIAPKKVVAKWNYTNKEEVNGEYVVVPSLQESDLPSGILKYSYYEDSAFTKEVTLSDLLKASAELTAETTYYVKAEISGTANYVLTNADGVVQPASTSFVIGTNKTVIVLELRSGTIEYDGTGKDGDSLLNITQGAGTVSGFEYAYYKYSATAADNRGDKLADGELPTDAGQYVIVVSLKAGDETTSALQLTDFVFTIQAKEIDVSLLTWDYSGTPFAYEMTENGAKEQKVALEYGGNADLDSFALIVEYTNNVKSLVSSYTATAKVTLSDEVNYRFTGSDKVSYGPGEYVSGVDIQTGKTYHTFKLAWSIEPMFIETPADKNITYSGEEIFLPQQAFAEWKFGIGENYLNYFTVDVIYIPDIAKPGVTEPCGVNAKNVGTYVLTLKIADAANTQFADKSYSKQINIVIDPLTLTVTGWTPAHAPVFAEGSVDSAFYTLVYSTDAEGKNIVIAPTEVGMYYYRTISVAEEHKGNVDLSGELLHGFMFAEIALDAQPVNLPTFTAGGTTYDYAKDGTSEKLEIGLTYNTQNQSVKINGWDAIKNYVELIGEYDLPVSVNDDGEFTVNEAGVHLFKLRFRSGTNCKWANAGDMYNGYQVNFPIQITVEQMAVTVPVLSEMPVYTSSELSLRDLLVASGYEYIDYIVLSGETAATAVGNYTATVSLLNDNFCWAQSEDSGTESVSFTARLSAVSSLADGESDAVELNWSITPYALTWAETENGPVVVLPDFAENVDVSYTFERDGKTYASYSEALQAGGDSNEIKVRATLSGAGAGNFGFINEATGDITNTSELTVNSAGELSFWEKVAAFLTMPWLLGLSMWIWLLIFLLVFILLLIIIICSVKHRKKKKAAAQAQAQTQAQEAAAQSPVVNINTPAAAQTNELQRLEQERLLREQQLRMEREEEERRRREREEEDRLRREREEEDRRRRDREYEEEKRRREELAALAAAINKNGNNNGGLGGIGMGINGMAMGMGGAMPVMGAQPVQPVQPVQTAQPAATVVQPPVQPVQPVITYVAQPSVSEDDATDDEKLEKMREEIRAELKDEFDHQARVEQILEMIMRSREEDRMKIEEEEKALEMRKKNYDARREGWIDSPEPQISKSGEEYYQRMGRGIRVADERDYRIRELEMRLREMEARQWMQYQPHYQSMPLVQQPVLPQFTQSSHESERVRELENKLREMEDKQREIQRREEEDRRFRELEDRLSARLATAQQSVPQPAQPVLSPIQPAPKRVQPIVVQQPASPVSPTRVQPGAVMTTTTTTTIDASKKEKEEGFPDFKTGYRPSDNDGKYN